MSTETNLYFTTRDRVFTITVYGLRPSTIHYCYFERQLVPSSQIKPYGKNLGDNIVSDQSGQVVFDFYYQSGASTAATSIAEGQRLAASLAGVKELVVINQNTSSLSNDYEQTADSFFSTQIQISVFIPTEQEYEVITKPYVAPVVAAPVGGDYITSW